MTKNEWFVLLLGEKPYICNPKMRGKEINY